MVNHLQAEFKEFDSCLKFETWLKHGWFHLKLYQCSEIWAGSQLEPVFGGSATRGINSLNSNLQKNKMFWIYNM